MKTYVSKALLFFFLFSILLSCTKFENGPLFSFLSVKKRLARDWKVEYAINKETDKAHSADFEGWLLRFETGGTFSKTIIYNQKQLDYSGTWEILAKNRLKIMYNATSGDITEHYTILRLTKKELWLTNEYNEFHYYSD